MSAVRRCLLGAIVLLFPAARAQAQELEPGAYWPIPRGLNIVSAIANVNWGEVTFEPSLPVEEASARIGTTAVAFTHAFGMKRRSANVLLMVPVVGGHLKGRYLGEPTEVDRFGLADPKFKVGVNLYGAPSMTPKEFASYQHRLIVGVSLSVVPPLGQYDPAKLVNLGTNRWSIKPELGLSRSYGPWIIEGMAGVWLFTDNDDFAGGRTRQQDPIISLQAHFTRRFNRGTWLAADANYYRGGQTRIDDRRNIDFQSNSRIGATFSRALTSRHSLRASISRGAYTTIGASFTSLAFGYNYAWAN
jgi:hypothetical protein